MRIEQPRLATPYEKVFMSAVSCLPVSRRSLPSPYAAMWAEWRAPSWRMAYRNRKEDARETRGGLARAPAGGGGRVDGGAAASLAHLLGGEVGVAAGAVPVAVDGLRVEGAVDAEILAHALQDVARDHQLVGRGDANARPNLVLPLARHHLGVGARDGDAGVEASLVVRLGDGAAKGAVGASAAVVRALRAREAALRPSERRDFVEVEERVLLLDPEPRHLFLATSEALHGGGSGVGGESLAGRRVGVGEDEDVVAGAEGVLEDGARLDDHLRVLARCLVARRAVVVPRRQLVERRLLGVNGAALGANLALCVDPQILRLNLAWVRQVHVAVEDCGVCLDKLGHARRGEAGRAGHRALDDERKGGGGGEGQHCIGNRRRAKGRGV
mmetsp:Transcript_4242/g.13644  ORF Transcript_4242/g.13644 Transcript_4242/m.13644 type:complete len:385 (-) Transcript_4242:10-1164(-)